MGSTTLPSAIVQSEVDQREPHRTANITATNHLATTVMVYLTLK